MKKFIVSIAASVICLGAFAQVSPDSKNESAHWKDKYCTKMKDGKMVVMHDGKQITSDVNLSNGARITTDATLVQPDGTRTTLASDQCVDKEGNINSKEKNKMKRKERENDKNGY